MCYLILIIVFLAGLVVGAYLSPKPVLNSIRVRVFLLALLMVVILFFIWQALGSKYFTLNNVENSVFLTALTALITGWCFYKVQGIEKSQSIARKLAAARSIALTKMFADLAIPRALCLSAKVVIDEKQLPPTIDNEILDFHKTLIPLIQSYQKLSADLDSVEFPNDKYEFYSVWRMAIYSFNEFINIRNQYEKIKLEKIDYHINKIPEQVTGSELLKVIHEIPINEIMLFKSLAEAYQTKLDAVNLRIYKFYEYVNSKHKDLVIGDLHKYVDDGFIRDEQLDTAYLYSEKNNKELYEEVYGSIDKLMGQIRDTNQS